MGLAFPAGGTLPILAALDVAPFQASSIMPGVALRKAGMPGRLPDRIEKVGQGVLLVALAPILLLLVLILIGRSLYEACATRLAGSRQAKP
jgi:hypothetical protein